MSSPFPGMDPYLEDPAYWSDFHAASSRPLRPDAKQPATSRAYVTRNRPQIATSSCTVMRISSCSNFLLRRTLRRSK
jgi:hypothetical protein